MWNNNTQETCSRSCSNNAFLPFRQFNNTMQQPHSRINQQNMAFHSLRSTPISSLFLLLLIILLPCAISQNLSIPGSTIAECSLRLLPLVSCASYVQGSAPIPVQSCCDNLKQAYSQQPSCLCLLLNGTVAGSFPVNRTLALQLPVVCNLQVGFSPCSEGMTVPPPTSSDSQVSLGEGTNSTIAASPVVAVAPRPNIMGFGFGRSSSMRLEVKGDLAVAAIGVTCLLMVLF